MDASISSSTKFLLCKTFSTRHWEHLLTGCRKCGSDEVRLQIAFCGICGTDIHEYLGGPIFAPLPGTKNKITGVELPVTLGHEFSGTIIEIGSGVTDFKLGQRVIVNPAM